MSDTSSTSSSILDSYMYGCISSCESNASENEDENNDSFKNITIEDNDKLTSKIDLDVSKMLQ